MTKSDNNRPPGWLYECMDNLYNFCAFCFKCQTPSNGQTEETQHSEQTKGHNRQVLDKSNHSLHFAEQYLKSGQIHPCEIFQFIIYVNF